MVAQIGVCGVAILYSVEQRWLCGRDRSGLSFEDLFLSGDLYMNAVVPSGLRENFADKLRFSITCWRRDCAKLQRDQSDGLHGLTGTIAFDVQQELELFLIASRSYALVVEGDVVQTGYDDVGNHSMRKFNIGWSDSAKRLGTGSGVVKLVNPEFPNDPCCFALTVGACQCDCNG